MKVQLRDVYVAAESANCLHQGQQRFRRECAEQAVEAYETKTADEVLEVFMTFLKTRDTLRVMERRLHTVNFTKWLRGHWKLSGWGRRGSIFLWM